MFNGVVLSITIKGMPGNSNVERVDKMTWRDVGFEESGWRKERWLCPRLSTAPALNDSKIAKSRTTSLMFAVWGIQENLANTPTVADLGVSHWSSQSQGLELDD